jgi:hypothetical protein
MAKLIVVVLQLYSADVPKSNKKYCYISDKIKLICCLSYLKSHTRYRVLHVIFKRGEHAVHVTINCCGAMAS